MTHMESRPGDSRLPHPQASKTHKTSYLLGIRGWADLMIPEEPSGNLGAVGPLLTRNKQKPAPNEPQGFRSAEATGHPMAACANSVQR